VVGRGGGISGIGMMRSGRRDGGGGARSRFRWILGAERHWSVCGSDILVHVGLITRPRWEEGGESRALGSEVRLMIEAEAINAASVAGDISAIHLRLIASCWDKLNRAILTFSSSRDRRSLCFQEQKEILHRERVVPWVLHQ